MLNVSNFWPKTDLYIIFALFCYSRFQVFILAWFECTFVLLVGSLMRRWSPSAFLSTSTTPSCIYVGGMSTNHITIYDCSCHDNWTKNRWWNGLFATIQLPKQPPTLDTFTFILMACGLLNCNKPCIFIHLLLCTTPALYIMVHHSTHTGTWIATALMCSPTARRYQSGLLNRPFGASPSFAYLFMTVHHVYIMISLYTYR